MEQKNNSGVAFKNNKKANEKHPDYKGKCVVDGKDKEVAFWIKKASNGSDYFTFVFQEPYKPKEGGKDEQNEEKGELPF